MFSFGRNLFEVVVVVVGGGVVVVVESRCF
jgi:hypothetical protein